MQNKRYLPHSIGCFICGEENSYGLACRFYADSQNNVHLDTTISPRYTGFNKVVHGGIQSAILDETMGWCGFIAAETETLFFTRELKVKFKKNLIAETPIYVTTSLVDYRKGFAYTSGIIQDEAGTILTTSEGIFVAIPKEKMDETCNQLSFIDDGRTYHEKAMQICKPKRSFHSPFIVK